MNKLQTIICRLCLQKCVNFKIIDDYVKDVLDVLLLKINLSVSEKPAMCTNCAAMLMRCFDFKATCIYTHDFIVPFLDDEKISKLDLKKVFISKHENVIIPEDHSVCGFCMGLAKKCTALSFDNEEGDFMLEKLKYLPELDFSTIEEPVICAPCYESLKTCLHFVTSCLIVEEKIMEYRKLTGADVIEIADILQLSPGKVSREEYGNTIDIVSTEEKFCIDSESADKQVGQKDGSFAHMEEQKFLQNEDIEIKTDQSDFDRFQELLNENETPNDPLHTSVVISGTRNSKNVIKQHLLIRKNSSEIDTFKCKLCSYETKLKCRLWQHLLIHKSPSKIKMFKCDLCSYEAKLKSNLKRHLLSHKSASEIKMFKCDLCSYEARLESNLRRHLLTHKSPSEVKLLKCELCSYETKQKYNLKSHLLTHKSPSEIKMFKCELCSYEAKRKVSIKFHFISHKNPSDIKMFKCELCPYEAKRKSNLNAHLLTHKHPSEMNMFECDLCSYKARQKVNLRNHLLTHSELKMFKCELCSFETKHKHCLKRHLLTHKCPSEIEMFKCELCSYQVRQKRSLKRHLLTHKSLS